MTQEELLMDETASTSERLRRASALAREAIRLLEDVEPASETLWEAKCSFANAVACLRLARGER